MGDYTLVFEFGDLTPFGEQVARDELRENEENRQRGFEELRALLQTEMQENGLVVPLDNDYWLLRWLRPCKFYSSSAFELV